MSLAAYILALLSSCVYAAAPEASRIIKPAGAMGQAGAAPIILIAPPLATELSIPSAELVLPKLEISGPQPLIVPAARALTEAEASPAKLGSQEDLRRLADSLAAGGAEPLDAAFDGSDAQAPARPESFDARFLAPRVSNHVVKAAARFFIARLLPAHHRRVPTAVELPAVPRATGVQPKIAGLIGYAHEYFGAFFDAAVRGEKSSPEASSAYAALRAGYAVGGELLLIERLLETAPASGLTPRDAQDLASISSARRQTLDVSEDRESEGIVPWRKAHQEGGAQGMSALLSSLSAERMLAVPRADPAYQLALGEPALLSAYLGSERSSPNRLGLEAFGKAAAGEALTEDETRDAAAVAEQAGHDAWRRIFDRTLTTPGASVSAAFALARLSPAAGSALARYLANVVSSPGGAARLFERPGPSEKLQAITAGAQSLPWDDADAKAWNEGLIRWLIPVRGA